jgi:hypothetical protein
MPKNLASGYSFLCCCTGRFEYEHTISLRFLGIILRVLRLGVFIYNVYNTNQFPTTFAGGGGGGTGGVKFVIECE